MTEIERDPRGAPATDACAGHRAPGRWGGLTTTDRPGLPDDAAVGFATGATMASFTCLAAARDEVLRRHAWGRGFIRVYYRHGPGLARWVVGRPRVRREVRRVLTHNGLELRPTNPDLSRLRVDLAPGRYVTALSNGTP